MPAGLNERNMQGPQRLGEKICHRLKQASSLACDLGLAWCEVVRFPALQGKDVGSSAWGAFGLCEDLAWGLRGVVVMIEVCSLGYDFSSCLKRCLRNSVNHDRASFQLKTYEDWLEPVLSVLYIRRWTTSPMKSSIEPTNFYSIINRMKIFVSKKNIFL